MEFSRKLLKFKFHILFVLTFSLFLSFICYIAPRFLDILMFFWPLFVSTAMFLVAVLVFDRISPVAEALGEKTGQGLLDYVAGQPEQVQSLDS
ncbi:hypothetical protein ACJIZ3_013019 [Penstemon smallii]|uniref:Uncharacterized protein n=1 Tax=Penstemon smallii TaxID=265156 RepID=A0ABD3USA0_9LAMI